MNTLSEKPAVLNLVLAGLMIVMMVLSCVGCYSTDSGTYSIMGYIAMPSDYPELESFFESNVEEFNINDVVGAPLWVFLIGAVACVVCLVWRDRAAASLAAVVWSVGGLIGYISSAYLPLGNAYYLHICILVLALALAVINSLGLKRELATVR